MCPPVGHDVPKAKLLLMDVRDPPVGHYQKYSGERNKTELY